MMKTRHSRLNIPGTETKYVLLPSSAIDAQKWDACISLSAQPVIYATHNYLNHFSDKWMGFVFGDYDAVMPVTLKEKFRLIYLYPAPFVQQSGLFGETDAIDFVSILAKHFRYGNYVFYNKTGNATYHKKIRSKPAIIIISAKKKKFLLRCSYIRSITATATNMFCRCIIMALWIIVSAQAIIYRAVCLMLIIICLLLCCCLYIKTVYTML